MDRTLERRREEDAGISTLFSCLETDDAGLAPKGFEGLGDARVPIGDQEFDKGQRLTFEKEMLGLYVSDHPLRGVEAALARLTECSIADLKDLDDAGGVGSGAIPSAFRDGQVKVVGGIVTGLNRRYTKRGELMGTFFLEDLGGSIEVFVFPKVMQVYGALLADDSVVVVKGRIDTRDEQVKLVCIELSFPTLVAEGARELRLRLPLNALTDGLLERLKAILSEHPGDEPVYLNVGHKTLRLPSQFNVDSRGLAGELLTLLGPGAVMSEQDPPAGATVNGSDQRLVTV